MTNTMQLDGRTYSVVKATDGAIALLGARGAGYVLIRNLRNPDAWCLIPEGSPKRTTWFRRLPDGAFEASR